VPEEERSARKPNVLVVIVDCLLGILKWCSYEFDFQFPCTTSRLIARRLLPEAGVTFEFRSLPHGNVLNSLRYIFQILTFHYSISPFSLFTVFVGVFTAKSVTNVNHHDENIDTADFPFDTDPDDHCESPIEAYEDIVPVLQACARKLKKSQTELSIYDPYYCDNRVTRNLASLGFPNVYNRKDDCYKTWDNPLLYPSNDMLVTNPPYSGDHIEKLIRHVTEHPQQRGKPFALLLPVFVHKKDYYEGITKPKRGQSNNASCCCPIYLVPHKRYVYHPPPNFRAKKVSDTHKKSSPFPSMWYIWGGSEELTDEIFRILQKPGSSAHRFSVARSKSALRDLRRKHKK
jgi:hypothetical protein